MSKKDAPTKELAAKKAAFEVTEEARETKRAEKAAEKAPRHDPTRRGTRKQPASSLDVSALARKKVRKMLNVLEIIATDPGKPAAARVSAAKTMIDLAKFNPEDLRNLPDDELFAVVKALAEKRAPRLKKELEKELQERGDTKKLH